MKFWSYIKRIGKIVLGIGTGVLFIVVLASSVKQQKELICNGLTVKINYDSGLMFLEEQDVHKTFLKNGHKSMVGSYLTEINFSNIENLIKQNPYVRTAEVYSNLRGHLIVQLEQKTPALRIINNEGVSFYLSDEGEIIPLSSKFTPKLLVVTGFINIDSAGQHVSSWKALLRLAEEIKSDKLLNAAIDQIYVTENKEVELISLIQNQTILLGNMNQSMNEELDKLKIFYHEGLKNVNWKNYKTINLKFKDQIICKL